MKIKNDRISGLGMRLSLHMDAEMTTLAKEPMIVRVLSRVIVDVSEVHSHQACLMHDRAYNILRGKMRYGCTQKKYKQRDLTPVDRQAIKDAVEVRSQTNCELLINFLHKTRLQKTTSNKQTKQYLAFIFDFEIDRAIDLNPPIFLEKQQRGCHAHQRCPSNT